MRLNNAHALKSFEREIGNVHLRDKSIGVLCPVSYELYRRLAERARYFFEESSRDAAKKRYDIALFHLEQALQLGIKAYMLRTKGDSPKVHDLGMLIKLTENQCLAKLTEGMWYDVSILNDAYIASRYLAREYSEKEYRSARSFVRGALKCLGIIES
ncbi:HEPN domain-containing protein [Caldivirga sp.]|uniref:HEPN domain-containing protein n=1 Tax=Caldivirga sp. TaxID=2080243 RepID=UPI003D14F13C